MLHLSIKEVYSMRWYYTYLHTFILLVFDFLYSDQFSKKLLYKRCTDVNSVSYVGINFCGKLLTLSI